MHFSSLKSPLNNSKEKKSTSDTKIIHKKSKYRQGNKKRHQEKPPVLLYSSERKEIIIGLRVCRVILERDLLQVQDRFSFSAYFFNRTTRNKVGKRFLNFLRTAIKHKNVLS